MYELTNYNLLETCVIMPRENVTYNSSSYVTSSHMGNNYISLSHILVRDESDAKWKGQKINYDDHFCPSFEIRWSFFHKKNLHGHFYLHFRDIYITIFAL